MILYDSTGFAIYLEMEIIAETLIIGTLGYFS